MDAMYKAHPPNATQRQAEADNFMLKFLHARGAGMFFRRGLFFVVVLGLVVVAIVAGAGGMNKKHSDAVVLPTTSNPYSK